MEKIRIVVADDHAVVREGTHSSAVGTLGDCSEGVAGGRSVAETGPELLGESGFAVARPERSPELNILNHGTSIPLSR